jgi:hypothetical protein
VGNLNLAAILMAQQRHAAPLFGGKDIVALLWSGPTEGSFFEYARAVSATPARL